MLSDQITSVLGDANMGNDQKVIAIMAAIDQYVANHDNEILNKIGEIFSSVNN